jgi:dTMP kinase
MYKGFYVTLEGIDGAGKTTVLPLLAERLKQAVGVFPEVITSFEPGGTDYGQRIRGLLFDVKQAGVKNLHPSASGALYLSDHIQHMSSKIAPALADGNIVVQDRSFIDSQRAYYPSGESDPCYQAHNILHTDCIKPDITFLLNLEPSIALQRALSRGDEKFKAKPWSNVEALTSIAYRYMTYSAREPNRFVVLSLAQDSSPEAIAEAIVSVVVSKYLDKNALQLEHEQTHV